MPYASDTPCEKCHLLYVCQCSSRPWRRGADTDALIPSGFSHHHGTNGIYSHDPHDSSALSGANDEDSSAGSPDEADGELQLTTLSTQQFSVGRPRSSPRHSPPCKTMQFAVQQWWELKPVVVAKLNVSSLIYPAAGSQHDCDWTRKRFLLHALSNMYWYVSSSNKEAFPLRLLHQNWYLKK